jgi:RNA polymerase sigma-70 factor (ECF subfamily)
VDDRLADLYWDKVFRLAISILGPGREADAEEVTQDTFLRAVQGWPRFRGDSSPGSWLYRIAYNRALDMLRSPQHRLPRAGDRDLDRLRSGHRTDCDDEHRDLLAAIDELPQVYQVVLRQYYWLEMGIGEIAEAIDAPEGTVKSHLHRARKLLAEILDERGAR